MFGEEKLYQLKAEISKKKFLPESKVFLILVTNTVQ